MKTNKKYIKSNIKIKFNKINIKIKNKIIIPNKHKIKMFLIQYCKNSWSKNK